MIMTNTLANDTGLIAARWRGVLALAFGLTVFFLFFVAKTWNVSALGEAVEHFYGVAVTWLMVILPVCGFVLGVLGVTKDEKNGFAIAATALNVLGVALAVLIMLILAG
jgi:hypothetical protein